MIEKVMNNKGDIIAEKPPLAIFSLIKSGISDDDYIRLAYRFARQCGIKLDINELPDSYCFHFYLKENLVLGEYSLNWVQLIQESDSHVLSVYCGLPQIIKASFYRSKNSMA